MRSKSQETKNRVPESPITRINWLGTLVDGARKNAKIGKSPAGFDLQSAAAQNVALIKIRKKDESRS